MIDRLLSLLLYRYRDDDSETFFHARGLLFLYSCIVLLLLAVQPLTPVQGVELMAIRGMLAFSIILIIILCMGYRLGSIKTAISGFFILISIMVFSSSNFNRYEVYKITTFYLLIVFISALEIKRRLFSDLMTLLSISALWGDYFIRARKMFSPEKPVEITDTVACSGLLILALIIVRYVTARNFRVLALARNETEVKEQQAVALYTLQRFLNEVIDTMPLAIISVDLNFCITKWNISAEKLTGSGLKDAEGKSLRKVLDRPETWFNELEESMKKGESVGMHRVFVMHNGEPKYENVSLSLIGGMAENGAVICIDDVTEQVRIQEILIQTEKMMSVGGMAAGMAHEVNNPLSGILQSVSVIDSRLGVELPANKSAAEELGLNMETIAEYHKRRGIFDLVRMIRDSGNRASEVVSNMLSYARKSSGTDSFANADLGDIVERTLKLIVMDLRPVEVECDFPANKAMVFCSASSIQQVVINILKNGVEAMVEEKKSGANRRNFNFRIAISKDGDGFLLTLSDNGPGMPEDVQNRIFDPFFTTKPAGLGTGLGLSVSRFIVEEQHEGRLSMTSEKGVGTTFNLKFPERFP
ncbi:MAG: PAS domain S-box protein [Deltaproteobacteria bacterium]|nr:PAS domain S-box protein [Deltaproteobacteria bacterium]